MTPIALLTLSLISADPKGLRLDDGVVRFEVGSDSLDAESLAILKRTADVLRKHPSDDVWLIGHTDSSGSQELNRSLSTRRADFVKMELVKLGIDGDRIRTQGVGSDQPVNDEPGSSALNRRVEIWIGSPDPVAWISWIQEIVEASPPAGQRWEPAKLEMALRRLFRVRTHERSASEVRFDSANRLYVGPKALVVIYGESAKAQQAPKTRAVDVKIETGSLFAKLAEREGATKLKVESHGSKIKLSSRKTRVEYDTAKKASTLSVYDGRAEVEAVGSTVKVDQGFGTRVKDGNPPEPATRLADPPSFTFEGGFVSFDDARTPVTWRPNGPETLVEVAQGSDPAFDRPIREERSSLASWVPDLAVGYYQLRLTSIDDRGIVGNPGPPVALVVSPAPTAEGTRLALSQGAEKPTGARQLARAAVIDPLEVPSLSSTWTTIDGIPLPRVTASTIARLSFSASSRPVAVVDVPIELSGYLGRIHASGPIVRDGLSKTEVTLELTRAGAPADSETTVSYEARVGERGVETEAKLAPVECLATLPTARGTGGRYSLVLEASVGAGPSRALFVCDRATGVGATFALPDVPAAPTRTFVELAAGSELSGPRLAISVRGGWTLPMGFLSWWVGPEVGLVPSSVSPTQNERNTAMVPIMGRLGASIGPGNVRVLVAAAGGLGVLANSTTLGGTDVRPTYRLSAGLDAKLGNDFAALLEAAYSPSVRVGLVEASGGSGISLGLRAVFGE
ncbi:MAG: OmpA family protein [Deltaproteobacteria bacterium]|nr:OmpA family protein [Deltaproteobacteria bacterium]